MEQDDQLCGECGQPAGILSNGAYLCWNCCELHERRKYEEALRKLLLHDDDHCRMLRCFDACPAYGHGCRFQVTPIGDAFVDIAEESAAKTCLRVRAAQSPCREAYIDTDKWCLSCFAREALKSINKERTK